MYCGLCGGCGSGTQQVNVNYLSSENPPINGTLPVRAQRFLQTDNDLQQSKYPCNFMGCRDFSYAVVSGICSGFMVSSGDIL